MANLFKENAIDKKKEKEGIWVDWDETCKFKLASAASSDFQDAFAEKTKMLSKRFKTGKIKVASQQHALAEILSEIIVKDWSGVEWGKKGEILEYSKENCLMILKDKQAGIAIMDWILENSKDRTQYLEFDEDDVKN